MDPSEKIIVKADSELADLIPVYLKRRESDLAAITAAAEARDFDRLQTLGHQMKGSGAGYGFDVISEIGAALEVEAKEKRTERVSGLVSRLADFLKRVEVDFEPG